MSATRIPALVEHERALFEHHPVPTWEFDCAEAFTFLEHSHAPRAEGEELSDELISGFARRMRLVDLNCSARRFLRCKTVEEARARYTDGSAVAHRMLGARKAVAALWRGERTGCDETTTTVIDGSVHSISICMAFKGEPGDYRQPLLVSVHDTTAQREVESALRRHVHHQELALRAGNVGTFEMDLASGRGSWSSEFAELWSIPPDFDGDLNALCWPRVHPDDVERVRSEFEMLVANPGTQSGVEFRVVRPDGTVRWVAWRQQVIGDGDGRRVIGVNLDITERRKLEDAFRQAQKMEAFGQLAAGVAHDFNNLLTVMIGNLDLLAQGGPVDEEVTQELQQAVMRASNLTRQLLAFSRQAPQVREQVNLNDVAGNMVRLLKRLIGAHIVFSAQLDAAPLLVLADAGMLEQVLVNLTLNARDAMPHGGELRISTRRVTLTEDEVEGRQLARAGRYAVLTVSDTGTGIDPLHRERIFEPFFTTKDAGKGTGLGLATALGIVQQHRGWIEVQSAPARGSSFMVFLPLEVPAGTSGEKAARATVLLAEDEAPVRRLLKRLLDKAGYDVLEACTGPEAVDVWTRHKDRIALLITDMVMPGGISGRQLATRMTLEKPSLKVMYASGYVPEGAEALTLPGSVFITKPFSREELVRKVSELLGEPPRS